MEAFMEDAHDKATSTKILLSNYAAQESTTGAIRCKKCHKFGHKKEDCPDNLTVKIAATRVQKNDDSDDDDDNAKQKEKEKWREICGKCPLCK